MNRGSDLVTAAGIDPRQGAAETAALMVRRLPMRINGRPQATPEERKRGNKLFWDAMDSITYDPENIKLWSEK